mmetsp:Transcript_12496/g.22562  ORF Transcript_12496/g.22562 Transcript_12496/m.22562 type:complete len:315 (-) Transcript_12496:772-1716(-)|eukprot:CAMPEP_0182448320 /NCGR_PEP_ID=MMETSP1172-20130603/25920_1 /TAXON_ID=708627 /ORGANISM="Timspurckia oligopyrenoides, Strain CCMP3278" /LENGTH=314 /DNA_ID=CAMNT_0024645139 /DNA_START=82 /DNA_END=1026 /DNA_ORIENTATION=+
MALWSKRLRRRFLRRLRRGSVKKVEWHCNNSLRTSRTIRNPFSELPDELTLKISDFLIPKDQNDFRLVDKFLFKLLPDTTPGFLRLCKSDQSTESEKKSLGILIDLVTEANSAVARNSVVQVCSILWKQRMLTLDDTCTEFSEVSTLSGLKNLEELDLSFSRVSEISAIAELTNLNILKLGNTNVSNISALNRLKKLKALHLERTQVSDISALSKLCKLEYLNLAESQVSELSAIAGLANVRQLHLADTPISEISMLSSLTNLEVLDLEWTEISEISALKKLRSLKQLYLLGSLVSDVSVLSGLIRVGLTITGL